MDENWYYAQGSERKGPVAFGELVRLAGAGVITPTSLVWKKGMAEWVTAKAAPGLFDGPPTLPPTIPTLRPQDSTAIAPSPMLAIACLTGSLGGFCLSFLVGVAISSQLGGIVGILCDAAAIAAVVLGCIFIHRAWSCLPPEWRSLTPGKAVGFLFIPFFNLYWVFIAIYGLSKQTNQALRAKGLKEIAPENLGRAISIVFVASNVLPLLSALMVLLTGLFPVVLYRDNFTGETVTGPNMVFVVLAIVWYWLSLLTALALTGLFGLWLHKQAPATHEYLRTTDRTSERTPWVIALSATVGIIALGMTVATGYGIISSYKNARDRHYEHRSTNGD